MPDSITRALSLFVCVVAIALASNRAEEHEGLENNSIAGITGTSSGRGPASAGAPLATSKAHVLNPKSGRYIRHTEKLSGPVSVEIKMDSSKPSQAGDVMVMRGVIEVTENLDSVEYQWSVPSGVEVVNGNVNGTVTLLKAGEPREVTLTVKAGSMENEQIHILVKGDSAIMHFAQSAQYNTQDQELIELANKTQRKMLGEEPQEDSNSQLKIFH